MGLISRRTFLKGSAAVGGTALVARRFLFGGPETLVPVSASSAAPMVEDFVRTTCWIGKQDCGILARRIDGNVVKLDGDPAHPRNLGSLCPKGQAQIHSLYDPSRVGTPLVRTNAKGERGTWRTATWDEAVDLVARRVNEVRKSDPKQVLWQKGRSKSEDLYDEAFVKAIGATKMGHGGYCSDVGYRATEYTIGLHGVLHPDFRHCNFLVSWGWNITNAGGNKLCQITWPRELVDARARGLKVVHIDPRLRAAGPHTDSWLPIRPGTDLALALALARQLIADGNVDSAYLKRFTNAGSLVGEDGHIVRVNGTDLVWDAADGRPKPLAEASDPALEGTFDLEGRPVRPAFEVFKAHLDRSTPEWAAAICGLDAADIRRLAADMGREARIGATTVIDGVTVPLRPVGIMAYHMAQQELGFAAMRAMLLVAMLLGSVGAAGGTHIDFTWKVHDNYQKLDQIKIKDPPYDFALKESKFFPINSGLPGIVAKVMADPEKFGVEKLPRAVIVHMANPLVSFPDRKAFLDSWGKFEFVTVISPWLSETADYFADVVLPAATMEKYEGPIKADDPYVDAVTLRLPVSEPLYQSRGEIDIYLDLAEAMGVLGGEKGYLANINQRLNLGPQALPLDTKPTTRDIFDRWAKAQGLAEGIAYFEEHGVKIKGKRPPAKMYGYVADPPFAGLIHRLYGDSLLRYQEEMRAKGVDELFWQDYTPLPTWRQPTYTKAPDSYDLHLISYKIMENKQSRSSFNPLLAELAPRQRLDINPRTARKRDIANGDWVVVESRHALTGETRRVRVQAHYTQGIRPDTVGMPHGFGLWTHPVSKGMGPSPNELYFTGEGYVTNTADQSYLVMVRVERAEKGSA